MKDRIPVNPNRKKLTLEGASSLSTLADVLAYLKAAHYGTVEYADNPTEAGTALNKANLLSDATETTLFGSASNRTINQVLASMLIASSICSSSTKTRYGLTSTAVPDDVLKLLAVAVPPTPLQSYTTPGSYTFVVPDGVTKILVAAIGGGGSGQAIAAYSTMYSMLGGASGIPVIQEVSVTASETCSIVVGAGGAAVSATKSASTYDIITTNGNAGNTTSFVSSQMIITAVGGSGGSDGMKGGQIPFAPGVTIQSMGNIPALYGGMQCGSPGISYGMPAFVRMAKYGILPFCVSAIWTVGGVASSATLAYTLPNGKRTATHACNYNWSALVSANAAVGTDPGCGGGGASATTSYNYSATAVSSKGCNGGVFIYKLTE